jgi:hypothetical protein
MFLNVQMMFLLYSNEIFFVMFTWYFFWRWYFAFVGMRIFFYRVKYFGDLATSNLELIFVIVVGTSIWFQFWVVILCMNIV